MPVVLAGLLVAFLVMLLFGGTELDRGLFVLLAVPDDPRLVPLGVAVDAVTDPFVLAAIGAAGAGFLLARRDWRGALLLFAITAGGLLLAEYLATVTAALRPPAADRVIMAQPALFPNPAAAGTAAVGLGLAFLLLRHRPWRTVAVSAAVLMAFAVGTFQLVSGSAWPSDVIGGWALSLFWTLLLLWLAGEDLGEGTPRALRHSPPKGERHGQHPHGNGPPDGRQGAD